MNVQAKVVRWSVAAMLILACAGVAAAQPSGSGEAQGRKGRGQGMAAMAKDLNLTPEQQEQIRQQRAAEQQQNQALREQIKDIRSRITQELEKPVTDKAAVQALAAQMSSLIAQRVEQRIMGIIAMKEILTPEQFKAFNEKTKQFDRRKGGKR